MIRRTSWKPGLLFSWYRKMLVSKAVPTRIAEQFLEEDVLTSSFLAADTIQQVDRVIAKFPYFKNLKDDVILYGEQNPREVINLYLEGIEILDRNAIINEKKRNLEELNQLKNELSENKNALVEKEAEIARLKALLDSK